MRNNLKYLLLLVAMLTIGIGLGALMVKYHVAKQQERVTVRCDTVVRIDSIFIDRPVARDSIVTRYVTRYLPTAKSEADTSVTLAKEIVSHSNGGIGYSQDSVNVILPIEKKTYTSDQYTAWVSGYEARLDSIALYTKEVLVDKSLYLDKKRRRWGCVVGAGLGTNHKGVFPCVGITVGYVLF
ncbi:MAG: hypothetical protein MJZ12_01375 [Prevotella sp.]|nr:hypothetical protein [Prevotella sp.]